MGKMRAPMRVATVMRGRRSWGLATNQIQQPAGYKSSTPVTDTLRRTPARLPDTV
jgi:hypothetical protein